MIIQCACGCGTEFEENDGNYRKRRFVSGHNGRKYTNPTQYKREWNHRNRETRFKAKMSYHRKRKVKLIELKGSQCVDCSIKYNGKNAPIFQFHHLDPSVKDFTIGNQLVNKAWKILIAEIDKCVLLCANCHFMRHSVEN